ncbi:L-serine ammonia-lyase, iron-sulfur-dependent, subunit alpha [Clostridium sp. D33t1_170424_F3]|uniref:L-serine ammonia-lyase, iron-sulfur-dependent, subunit alpha n=1 Tax=Clostridium sp. D33t1_170424_F3 TaxID=2787099 RepID=UPI0018ABE974|nr:L-serine ammonia-lyase, iron-sulfur-dependent, subunit alpha [Clostridium sp. D33t1_170424_F3]
MAFQSVMELLNRAEEQNKPIWRIVLEDDLLEGNIQEKDSLLQMQKMWRAMCKADEGYCASERSSSGLVGGDGGKMQSAVRQNQTICGAFMGSVVARALKMGECNACMKRIVAAPTAGSCGVIPAVLITYQEHFGATEEAMIHALYVSAGFGQVIASRASIAGAQGGCQAEVGSASAMAGAALVVLRKGTPEMAAHAFSMALKNLLGLVCDPVAGLVEVPCVKRNVIGAVNALACADMALAGVESRIPPDEVVDAMRAVGDSMPLSLKETGLGGLAATPTGKQIACRLKNSF